MASDIVNKRKRIPSAAGFAALLDMLVDDDHENIETAKHLLDSISNSPLDPTPLIFDKLITLLKKSASIDFAHTIASTLFRILCNHNDIDHAIPLKRGTRDELVELRTVAQALASGSPISGYLSIEASEIEAATPGSAAQEKINMHMGSLQVLMEYYLTCYTNEANRGTSDAGCGPVSPHLISIFTTLVDDRGYHEILCYPFQALGRGDFTSFRILQKLAVVIMKARPCDFSALRVIKEKWRGLDSRRNRHRYFETLLHHKTRADIIDLILESDYDHTTVPPDCSRFKTLRPCHPTKIEKYYHYIRPFTASNTEDWEELLGLVTLLFQTGNTLNSETAEAIKLSVSKYIVKYKPYVSQASLATLYLVTSDAAALSDLKFGISSAGPTKAAGGGGTAAMTAQRQKDVAEEYKKHDDKDDDDLVTKDNVDKWNDTKHASVGTEVYKKFPQYGVFKGFVAWYNKHSGYRIKYEDDDEEDIGDSEYKKLKKDHEKLKSAYLSAKNQQAKVEDIKGKLLYKEFGTMGVYVGYVSNHNKDTGFYFLDFEDDDQEELDEAEMDALLKDQVRLKAKYQAQPDRSNGKGSGKKTRR